MESLLGSMIGTPFRVTGTHCAVVGHTTWASAVEPVSATSAAATSAKTHPRKRALAVGRMGLAPNFDTV